MAAKKRQRTKARTGVIYLDTAKLISLLNERGETWKSAGGPATSTWANISNGRGVFPSTAKRVANYLGTSVEALRRPQTVQDANGRDGNFTWPEHPEWELVDGTRSTWQRTTNGLEYFYCQVRHRLIGDKSAPVLGRARFYDLSRVPADDRKNMQEHLTRHAQICRSLAQCPQLVKNVSVLAVAGENFWWVIDEWFSSETLQERIAKGPLPAAECSAVMHQIALGLRTLHKKDIVLRELAPVRVLISEELSVRLTDLDLAKLLLRGKTVSAEWPVDPYRAPEVEGGKATPQSDFYSWGAILVHAVTGDCTIACHDKQVVNSLELPDKLKRVLRACLSPMPSKRPRSIDELMEAVEQWH